MWFDYLLEKLYCLTPSNSCLHLKLCPWLHLRTFHRRTIFRADATGAPTKALHQPCAQATAARSVGCYGLRAASFPRKLPSSKRSHLTWHCPFSLGTGLSQRWYADTKAWLSCPSGAINSVDRPVRSSGSQASAESTSLLAFLLLQSASLPLLHIPNESTPSLHRPNWESPLQALHLQNPTRDNYDPI